MKKLPDFILIPIQLINDNKLNPLDRNLYGFIYWLEHLRDGKCTASNKTLAELCLANIKSIQHSLERLEKAKYIIRIYKDKKRKLRTQINTMISFGVVSTGGTVPPNKHTWVPPTDNQNKKRIQEEKQKIISIAEQAPRGNTINLLIEEFKILNPSYERIFARKPQRAAAERLLKKYGWDKVVGCISAAAKCSGEPYAPTITTPCQLEEKLGQLIKYYEKQDKLTIKLD